MISIRRIIARSNAYFLLSWISVRTKGRSEEGTRLVAIVADDLRACPDQNAGSDFGVAVGLFRPRPSKCNSMKNRDVILDHDSLAGDKARGVIEEHAFADFCAGMECPSEKFRRTGFAEKSSVALSGIPEPMRKPVSLDCGVAFEEQERLEQPARGGSRSTTAERSARAASPIEPLDKEAPREASLLRSSAGTDGWPSLLARLRASACSKLLESRTLP